MSLSLFCPFIPQIIRCNDKTISSNCICPCRSAEPLQNAPLCTQKRGSWLHVLQSTHTHSLSHPLSLILSLSLLLSFLFFFLLFCQHKTISVSPPKQRHKELKMFPLIEGFTNFQKQNSQTSIPCLQSGKGSLSMKNNLPQTPITFLFGNLHSIVISGDEQG